MDSLWFLWWTLGSVILFVMCWMLGSGYDALIARHPRLAPSPAFIICVVLLVVLWVSINRPYRDPVPYDESVGSVLPPHLR